MTRDRATGYGTGSPRITLAPVPVEFNKVMVNFFDTDFSLGALVWQIPTQSFVIYNGHGVWLPLGGPGSPLQTINLVNPVANNINIIDQGGAGALTVTAPGSGGPGTIGLGVNVDGISITIVGNTLVAGPLLLNPIQKIAVQAVTAPGVSPVLPSAGQVAINGALVAATAIPLQSRSIALNSLQLEAQITTAAAASLSANSGLGSFDSTMFTVDANGWVQLKGGIHFTLHTVGAASATTADIPVPNNQATTVYVTFTVGNNDPGAPTACASDIAQGVACVMAGVVTIQNGDFIDVSILEDALLGMIDFNLIPGGAASTVAISVTGVAGQNLVWHASVQLTSTP